MSDRLLTEGNPNPPLTPPPDLRSQVVSDTARALNPGINLSQLEPPHLDGHRQRDAPLELPEQFEQPHNSQSLQISPDIQQGLLMA